MKMLKRFIVVSFTIIFGIHIGTYIYKSSNVSSIPVFTENNTIYQLQYGVYSSLDIMEDASKILPSYFYYKDKDGYHVLIGIVENKNLSKKIGDSFGVKENIYIKEEKIDSMEFIESLRQYDSLVSSLKDNSSIINAEKQVLSKYEELVLSDQ